MSRSSQWTHGQSSGGTAQEHDEAVEAVVLLLTPVAAQHLSALRSAGWTEDEAREILDAALAQLQGNV